jgi:hypothetical protein
MATPANEGISRADFALVLKAASEMSVESRSDASLSLAEAERIAAEAGIRPDAFRAAVAAVATARSGKGRLFGPDGVLSAEASLEGQVAQDRAAHMLAQGQLMLSTAGRIEAPAEGLWRVSAKGILLQVATLGDTTTISAVSDLRGTRLGLLSGGAVIGTFAGVMAAVAATIGLGGSVEAVVFAQIFGTAGGAGAGLAAGVAAWRATARRTHEGVFAALERMRDIAAASPTRMDERIP